MFHEGIIVRITFLLLQTAIVFGETRNVFLIFDPWIASNINGTIHYEEAASTILQCSRLCVLSNICNAVVYNTTTNECYIFETSNGGLDSVIGLGTMYYNHKDCLLIDYQYIWQLNLCIKFVTSKSNWNNSVAGCKNDGGNLLAASTATKEKYIIPLLVQEYERTNFNAWWIGGTDSHDEGNFKWIDGKSLTHTNWAYNQPDDRSGNLPTGDCIRYLINNNGGQWYDRDCSNVFPYICENKLFA